MYYALCDTINNLEDSVTITVSGSMLKTGGDEDIEEIQIHLSKIDQSKHNNVYDDRNKLRTITLYFHTHTFKVHVINIYNNSIPSLSGWLNLLIPTQMNVD